MISAKQIYADAVRYWYQQEKKEPTKDGEVRNACPGLGTLKIEDKALLAATIYVLSNLPDKDAPEKN